MKWLKKIWELAGTKSGSAKLIAIGCIPLTLWNILFISESPLFNAAMVALNCLMLLLAVVDNED